MGSWSRPIQKRGDAITEITDRLTERQRRFVKRYVETGNGAASARDAGYSDVAEGARNRAVELVANRGVQDAIAEHSESLLDKARYSPVQSVERHMHRAAFDQDKDKRPDPVSKAADDTLLRMAGMLEPDVQGGQHAHLHLSGLSRERLEALEQQITGGVSPSEDAEGDAD